MFKHVTFIAFLSLQKILCNHIPSHKGASVTTGLSSASGSSPVSTIGSSVKPGSIYPLGVTPVKPVSIPPQKTKKWSLPSLYDVVLYKLLNRCPEGYYSHWFSCKVSNQQNFECGQNNVFHQGKCQKPNISWKDIQQAFNIKSNFKGPMPKSGNLVDIQGDVIEKLQCDQKYLRHVLLISFYLCIRCF